MKEAHDTPLSIHPGSTKMYQDIRQRYWWSNMKQDIARYVEECDVCHHVKAEHQRPAGSLQPLTIPEWKWDKVEVDFVRPDMWYCSRSRCFHPDPGTKHISVPPRHMTKSYARISNMISQHYRYKDTTSHTIGIQLPEYITTAEDMRLSTGYKQMPSGKGKTLSTPQQLKHLVLFCPKPYFRLVNNRKK